MSYIGTYDGKIFHNPSNKFCIIIVKTADTSIPEQARDKRRYKDHLIRFTAVGYEIPMTDAVELELDGEWVKGRPLASSDVVELDDGTGRRYFYIDGRTFEPVRFSPFLAKK